MAGFGSAFGIGGSIVNSMQKKAQQQQTQKAATSALGGFGAAIPQAPRSASMAPAQASVSAMAPVNYASPGAVTGGGNSNVSAAPPRQTFSMSDPNSRIAQTDSTFAEQEGAYNTNLEKIVADLVRRKQSLKRDTDVSRQGIAKNRELGMTGIGEDFAARGLGHSGLFVDASEKGTQAYERQRTAVDNAFTDGESDINFQEQKERSDTAAKIQSAKRDALYRLQLNNNLVTGL